MKGMAFTLSIFVIFVTASLVLAQQSRPEGDPGARPKVPEGLGGAEAYGQFLSLLAQRSRAASVPPTDASHPMFQLFGPDMRATFWADPEAAGRVLVLQGELMMKMGELLIQNGRAMLERAAEKQGK